MARPGKYTKIIAEEILSRYGDGEALSKICKDKNMPKRNTVYRWRYSYPEFGEAYELAILEHTDALVDQAGEIVDNEPNPQLAKVRSEFRRQLANKLNRSKYGEKIDVNHNVTIDIAPALLAANKRLKSMGVGNLIDAPVKQLVEADSDTM